MLSDLPEPVVITLNIGLNTPVGVSHTQVSEEEYTTHDITLLDAIITSVSTRFLASIQGNTDIARMVKTKVEEQVDAKVEALLTAEFERAWTPVDENGVPTGVRTRLVDEIKKSCEKMISGPTMKDGNYRDQPTPLGKFIDATATSVIAKELAPVVAQAKEMLVDRVKDSISTVLAAELVKAITK